MSIPYLVTNDLDGLLLKLSKTRRLQRELLKAPEVSSDGWLMYVPAAFDQALNIIISEVATPTVHDHWVQGCNFEFTAEDRLNDIPMGASWGETLKRMKYHIHIKEASRGDGK